MLVSLLLIASALVPTASSAKPALTLLGCVSGNNRVAQAQGCGTVPGSGGRATSAGLKGVVALAGGGSASSLYAIGSENGAITQLVAGDTAARLKFAACFTGDTFIERSCVTVPGAYANSDQAPIAYPTAAAISPDGRSLYLVSGSFHGSVIARFSREPLTGALTYVDCLTGDTDPGPTGVLSCTTIPGATHGGYGSGLDEPTGVVVSPNGGHVYVTSGLDQSLVTFARDPATGALRFDGCLSTNDKTTAVATSRSGSGASRGWASRSSRPTASSSTRAPAAPAPSTPSGSAPPARRPSPAVLAATAKRSAATSTPAP
jgi:hypothetical protein